MSVGNLPSNEYLIQSRVLDTATASVEFDVTGLGSQFRHLQLVCAAFSDSWITIRMNGVTTDGAYTYHELRGNGSSITSSANAGGQTFLLAGLGQASTGPTALITDFLDVFSTNKNKTIRSLAGTTSGGNIVQLTSGAWLSTSAITSIQVRHFNANFQIGSRFSLYGVTA